MSPAVRWSIAAVLGLLLAGVLAFASYQLVSQPIGLSAEPVTAGDELAPVRGGSDDAGGRADDAKKPDDDRDVSPSKVTDEDKSVDDSGGDDKGGDDKGGDDKSGGDDGGDRHGGEDHGGDDDD